MDNISKNFINALLDRNASTRLGTKGFEEIKNHEFFKSLDWELLAQRKIKPPIKPTICGQVDVQNFANEFTSQKPVFTPAECPTSFQSMFRGYSFVSPSVLFTNNNIIGEEILEESLSTLSKNSPFFSKYELCMDDGSFLGRGTFSVVRYLYPSSSSSIHF
jgi:hypothetical protein